MKRTDSGTSVARYLFFLALIFCGSTHLFGQIPDSPTPWVDKFVMPEEDYHLPYPPITNLALPQQQTLRWHTMFSQLPSDWARAAGLSLKSETIPSLVGLGVVTFGMLQTDQRTWLGTRRLCRSSRTFHETADYAVAIGDGRLHLAIAATFAGYGWLGDDQRALRTASQTVEAFLATGVTVQILKRLTGRESPIAATRHSGRWKFFPHPKTYERQQPSYYAFPSGHISTTMATVTVIAENYPEQRWIKPVGYTIVGALGVGLVSKGMHWYSDLPLGIALGYMFGKLTAHPESPVATASTPQETGPTVLIVPTLNEEGGGGVTLAIAF